MSACLMEAWLLGKKSLKYKDIELLKELVYPGNLQLLFLSEWSQLAGILTK